MEDEILNGLEYYGGGKLWSDLSVVSLWILW